MGDFVAALDWPSGWVWGMFALASGATALGGAWRHLARAWYQGALDRRLARNPYILREELSEYQRRIDDALPPLDLHRLLGSSLFVGTFTAIPAWLAERHLEQWWQAGWFAFWVLTILNNHWRRLNDPPEMHPVAATSEITVPREAWLGLAGGVAMVTLILLLMSSLV